VKGDWRDMNFSIRADRSLIRTSAQSRRYVRVEVRAPEAAPRVGRLPVNLGLVIDRSGSMAGEKIEMARTAVLRAIQCLQPQDRFSVVAYDTEVEVVVPSTLATAEARADAERRVRALEPGSSTDLCAGWLGGCEQVALHLDNRALGRCLLLTDGLANHGITDHSAITGHVSALRERGVTTTAFGVGADFDETLLRRMAEAGGGHFYFIETNAQIPDFLAGEVGDVLEVTAPDAALVIEAGEGVGVRSLNDFPCRLVDGAWRIELGSLVSGQDLDPVIVLDFPRGEVGSALAVTIGLRDRSGSLAAPQSVVFRYASDEENDAQPRERSVDRRVAVLYAAKASREALEVNRDGRYEEALQLLAACQRRIEEYAGDDAEIRAVLEDLERAKEQCSRPMASAERKRAYSTAQASYKAALRAPRSLRR
jgi:Ca-activated chloride channel homolog